MKNADFSKVLNDTVRNEIFNYLNNKLKVNESGSVYWDAATGFEVYELISVLRDGITINPEIADRDSYGII